MRVVKVTPDKLRPEDIIFEPATGKFWTIDTIHGDSDAPNPFVGPFTSWDVWMRELQFSVNTVITPEVLTAETYESELYLDNIIETTDRNFTTTMEDSYWKVLE